MAVSLQDLGCVLTVDPKRALEPLYGVFRVHFFSYRLVDFTYRFHKLSTVGIYPSHGYMTLHCIHPVNYCCWSDLSEDNMSELYSFHASTS